MECATCGAYRAVIITIAVARRPIVACSELECGHKWHVTMVDDVPTAKVVACTCAAAVPKARTSA